MNDIVATNNPFMAATGGLPASVNAGAVAIEQERAIAEAQGQLVLAKRFPRDLNASHADLMIACKSPAFAEVAFYSVPNRGTGPSIRFAEEVARVFGNFQYGHRELSRADGKSEIEVFAWDMQNNNRSVRQLTVMHVIDTKHGPKACRDQSEIDNLIANKASKQVRGRILALLPKWLVEDAIRECQKTLAGANDEPIEVRVRKMTQAFARFGVTPDHLERYLGHKLDAVLMDELVELQGVFNALREGAKASDYFGGQSETVAEPAPAMEKLGAAAAAAAASAAPSNDNPEPAPQAAPTRQRRKPAAAAPEPAPEPVAEQQAEPVAEQVADPDPQPETQADPEPEQAADPAPAEQAASDDEPEDFF